MENKQNRCSMTPLIYSIIPIGFALVLVAFAALFPEKGGDFPGSLMDIIRPLILCCTAPLIALWMVSMGIYSVVLGIAEIREPEARGKTIVVVAIFFGILDIVAGSGFLFYLFTIFAK